MQVNIEIRTDGHRLLCVLKTCRLPIHEFDVIVPDLGKVHFQVDGTLQLTGLHAFVVGIALDRVLHCAVNDITKRDCVVREELVQVETLTIPNFNMQSLSLKLEIRTSIVSPNFPLKESALSTFQKLGNICHMDNTQLTLRDIDSVISSSLLQFNEE